MMMTTMMTMKSRVFPGLLQVGLGDTPQFLGARPRREAAGELLAVDQPVGLGKAADDGGGEEPGGLRFSGRDAIAAGRQRLAHRVRPEVCLGPPTARCTIDTPHTPRPLDRAAPRALLKRAYDRPRPKPDART